MNNTKRIINIVVILLSLIITCYFISNKYSIILVKISLLILYLSILYIIITLFHKKTIKENIKKYKTKYIIEIIIISLLILYSFPPLIKTIPFKQEEEYTHGKKVLRKDLYTCEKANINPKYFTINEEYQEKAKKGKYTKLFDKESMPEININMHTNNLDYLRYNALEKPTVMANSISINNYKLNNVGIKTKGQTTLVPIVNSNNNLFSYTIKFKECFNKKNGFEENQNILGLDKLSLNNMLGDPTKMKEYLSYYLMTEMDVPTPEYTLAKLSINNQYQGLYFMLEPIDESLIKRTLQEGNEFTIKPDPNGGDLIYDYRLDEYIDETGKYNFDNELKDEEGNYILPRNGVLSKYNGIWENALDTLEDIYEELPMFFKWMRKLNELSNEQNKNTIEYEEELNKILDVDSLLRYWAVNIYIINTDSYTTHVKQNYALYMSKEGKVTIIPWDYNYSFGGANTHTVDEIINYNIEDPTINTTLIERPLLNVIFDNDNLKTKYKNYLNDVLIISSIGGKTSNNKEYPKDNLIKIINSKRKDIIEAEKLNVQAFYTKEEIKNSQYALIELIDLRTESVIKQLNNEESNIHTELELDTLGGAHSVFENKWNRMTKEKD